ncbi:DUF5615 family PIN-like protein [Catalinimonas niigatensis]|uniref:DUF5615 family PIN-like protein n=1 Tax=Catalinimonas niigatensis TaxID=1397264 RepID=UPI002666C382|nr:DUF5615 family PIN-like protein [Catalinimonas niigatensis]WPP48813.1 DUF5615 family PIN-like protein [Catalinimonas niigatensis]
MKILLDECVTKKLKFALAGSQVFTVTEMGWSGLKNGNLLTKAANENFDILLTIDKNMQHQQNVKQFPIAVVVFNVSRNKIEEFQPLLKIFYRDISSFKKGKVYKITA